LSGNKLLESLVKCFGIFINLDFARHVDEALRFFGVVRLGCKFACHSRWERAPDDKKIWIFHLRRGVKFHDGTDFNADAVIWNLDRYFKNGSAQFEIAAAAMTRARIPIMAGYRKIDDFTVAVSTKQPASYFPYMAVYILLTSQASFEKAGRDWARVAVLPAPAPGRFGSPRSCCARLRSSPAGTATGTPRARPNSTRSGCFRYRNRRAELPR
jgi:hypothetical protein